MGIKTRNLMRRIGRSVIAYDVTVSNKTSKSIKVTTPDGKKTTVASGKSKTIKSKAIPTKAPENKMRLFFANRNYNHGQVDAIMLEREARVHNFNNYDMW